MATDSTLNEISATDSLVQPMESQELPSPKDLGIGITIGCVKNVHVGDTFEFPVTVSWSVNGSSLLVLSTNSANAKGLTQISMSQESSRSVVDGQEKASVLFKYKIAAEDTGSLAIPALQFEIPTSMGVPLQLKTEPFPLQVKEPVNSTPIAVGFAVGAIVAAAAILRTRRNKQRALASRTEREFQQELREQMLILKQRINVADGRQWLLELEQACKKFAGHKFGSENLETLQKEGALEGWEGIIQAFAHARYGALARDTFENRETWKLAMKLMQVEEED